MVVKWRHYRSKLTSTSSFGYLPFQDQLGVCLKSKIAELKARRVQEKQIYHLCVGEGAFRQFRLCQHSLWLHLASHVMLTFIYPPLLPNTDSNTTYMLSYPRCHLWSIDWLYKWSHAFSCSGNSCNDNWYLCYMLYRYWTPLCTRKELYAGIEYHCVQGKSYTDKHFILLK